MTKYIYIILFILSFSGLTTAQNIIFPAAYEGVWEGEFKNYKPTAKLSKPGGEGPIEAAEENVKVLMQLEISKNDTAHCWNLVTRFIVRGLVDEKKYLLKQDSFSKSIIIEDQNNIKLYTYLMGNVLIERFSLPEKDITGLYKFSNDSIFTQTITSDVAPITWTGGVKGLPKVFSYFVEGYQDAVLVRKKK